MVDHLAISDLGVADFGAAVFDRWTAMWNGETALAPGLMAPRFVLRYAQPGTEAMDEVHTPAELSALITRWRVLRGNPVFRAEGVALTQLADRPSGASGSVVRPYSSTFPLADGSPHTVSGIDWLRLEAGRVVEVLSASGGVAGRPFALDDRPSGR